VLASKAGRACLAALLAVCLLVAGAAVAAADVEPNDVISQAEGPIAGGTPISGTFGTPDDFDYYVFYVQGQQQIHLHQSTPSGCSAGLLDSDGQGLPSDFTTPAGLNRYFVIVGRDYSLGDCSGQSYSFQIDPGSVVVSGPAIDRSFVQTGEPNESQAQAAGPLAGGVNYRGSIDTSNDQDWFFFFVAPGVHQIEATVTDPGPGPGSTSDCGQSEILFPGLGEFGEDATAYGSQGTFGHVELTLTGPSIQHVQALGCSYQLRIDPPEALTPTLEVPSPPPPPPAPKPQVSHACKLARGRVHAWSRRVHTLTVQVHHAHGAHSRHVLHVYLKAARRHLASALAQRRRHCPGGR